MSRYGFFAKTLQACMQQAGLNNSDLARCVWGTTTDNRGITVARNRDRIGRYLAGTSYPNPGNLWKIAGALGVPLEHLAFEFLNLSTNPPTFELPHRTSR